ncbi:hypothetical protein LTR70_009392 [Exophiala xenobiotica]|uniref:Uncharacterized protein n=1 Tax=Lithohypha guttulata TaxID=1690604 RepID=A0ABR0JXD9_9EURO|nr:hypothetical protein LTR24_009325 [Lithohypha guttulata]KAK5310529.1 hypothetical protein LTR70_009392 [Exophiala xenobiotica]
MSLSSNSFSERKSTRLGTPAQHLTRHGEISDNDNEAGIQTLTKLVKELKSTIDRQNGVLQETRAEVAQLRQEQAILSTQNRELQDEIRTLRNQLSVPSTHSWVSVVANGQANPSAAQSISSLPRTPSSATTNKEASASESVHEDEKRTILATTPLPDASKQMQQIDTFEQHCTKQKRPKRLTW